VLVKQVDDAERRERERQAQAEKEARRRRVRERAEARQRARQAAKEELRAIVKAWNDAFALEAFFTELSHHAAALDGDERANLEARIQVARELTGGQDAVDRFLKWKLPSGGKAEDEDALADAAHDDVDDEDN
jgi:GTP1/Obg family GTP-binding protein